LTEEYVISKLVAENFLEVDPDGDVFLVERKFSGFPASGRDMPYHFTHDLKPEQAEVLTKCFEWISSLQFPPNSLANLKTSINQLSFHTFLVDSSIVVDHLQTRKLVTIQEKKVEYFTSMSQAQNNNEQQEKS